MDAKMFITSVDMWLSIFGSLQINLLQTKERIICSDSLIAGNQNAVHISSQSPLS